MLKRIKRPVLETLKRMGVHREWNNSNWRRQRLAILCYHGIAIADEDQWNPELYGSQSWLDSRFAILRDAKFNVLSLGDAVRGLYSKTLPPRSVVVTFDDGGYDFFARALPVVRNYQFPVTVYLSTYYCLHQRPIFPLSCYYLLWKARDSYRDSMLAEWGCPSGLNLHIKADREKATDSIVSYARGLPAEERGEIVERLMSRLGLDCDAFIKSRLFQLMNPSEISELARYGIDVQLHTHRHRVPNDRELFFREIIENRQYIREMTGIEGTHFCYPSGVYDLAFLPWLRELGVASATTCENGLASTADDPLLLPRIADHPGLDEVEFESSLAGISTGLLRRRAS